MIYLTEFLPKRSHIWAAPSYRHQEYESIKGSPWTQSHTDATL